MDLLTLATGPVAHDLPITDGPLIKGRLVFDVIMEQINFVTVAQRNVDVAMSTATSTASMALGFSYQDDPSGSRKSKVMPAGRLSFRDMDRVRWHCW